MTEHINGPHRSSMRFGYKKGWRHVNPKDWKMNVRLRLQQLEISQLASDEVKNQARRLLTTIVDNRMPSADYEEARDLINSNKLFSKKAIAKAAAAGGATNHAIFMACQACENLHDMMIKVNSISDKNRLLLQIATAITVLGEVQSRILGGSDDSEG
jgi:hypothetical protein